MTGLLGAPYSMNQASYDFGVALPAAGQRSLAERRCTRTPKASSIRSGGCAGYNLGPGALSEPFGLGT